MKLATGVTKMVYRIIFSTVGQESKKSQARARGDATAQKSDVVFLNPQALAHAIAERFNDVKVLRIVSNVIYLLMFDGVASQRAQQIADTFHVELHR